MGALSRMAMCTCVCHLAEELDSLAVPPLGHQALAEFMSSLCHVLVWRLACQAALVLCQLRPQDALFLQVGEQVGSRWASRVRAMGMCTRSAAPAPLRQAAAGCQSPAAG